MKKALKKFTEVVSKMAALIIALSALPAFVGAQTYDWDFSSLSDYTISDVSKAEISSSAGRLVQTGYETELEGPIDIKVVGTTAYVIDNLDGDENGFQIIDISDVANPTHLGSINDSVIANLDNPYSLEVVGTYAYVGTELGLLVLDISDPLNISEEAFLADTAALSLDEIDDLVYVGGYLHAAANHDDAYTVIDISDPSNPFQVTALIDDGTTNFRGCGIIKVKGSVSYCSGTEAGFTLFDISNPASPIVLGSNSTGIFAEANIGFESLDNNIYIPTPAGPGQCTIYTLDVTNPTAIGLSAFTTLPVECGVTHVSGNVLYMTSPNTDSFSTIDISNPLLLILTDVISDTPASALDAPFRFVVDGNYAYVNSYGEEGMQIIDITDPANMSFEGSIVDHGNLEYPHFSVAPGIVPATGISYGIGDGLTSFIETLGPLNNPAGMGVAYQLSPDNGATWYYHDGTSWVIAATDLLRNSASDVNSNISTFMADTQDTGTFVWKVFLLSDSTTQAEIDNISIGYFLLKIAPLVIKKPTKRRVPKKGCTDPESLTYDEHAVIHKPSACEYTFLFTIETEPASCSYLTQYMKEGDVNGKIGTWTGGSLVQEVDKLKMFMNSTLGSSLEYNGVYDKKLSSAVHQYQSQNIDRIIKDWAPAYGLKTTGSAYKLTRKAINFDKGCPESRVWLEDVNVWVD